MKMFKQKFELNCTYKYENNTVANFSFFPVIPKGLISFNSHRSLDFLLFSFPHKSLNELRLNKARQKNENTKKKFIQTEMNCETEEKMREHFHCF